MKLRVSFGSAWPYAPRRLVESAIVSTILRTEVAATTLFGCACARPSDRPTPIPLPQTPAWAIVFSAPGFKVFGG